MGLTTLNSNIHCFFTCSFTEDGLCPLHDPPPRFDRIPFPWEDFNRMMMMKEGMDGEMEDWGSGMGGMPPVGGMPPMGGDTTGDRPMIPPDHDGMGGDRGDRPIPGTDMGDRPMPDRDMGDGPMPDRDMGERPMAGGDMSGEWSDIGDMRGDMGDMNPFMRWLHGSCSKDSECDGKKKCCGTFHKNCTTPLGTCTFDTWELHRKTV